MKEMILIVEDDTAIAQAVQIYLTNQGYQTKIAQNGQEGLTIVKSTEIHLAIVDIMMPVMDGLTFTMKVRETYDFPIIMLSARSEDLDKINGLNIGADDYLTKPFTPMELIARVQAQLRRYQRFLNMVIQKSNQQNILIVKGIELHKDSKQVYVDGEEKQLTPIEFKILALFMEYPNRVFSSEEIYERVWNEQAITTETVMVHIRNLREKIEITPKKPRYIKVVWGIGYKIEK